MAASIKKDVENIAKQLKRKFSSNLISIIQTGSSLRPNEMFPNSDLDFVVITKHKPKERFFSADSKFETNILAYSIYQFKKLLKEGNPIALMAAKFGKTLFNRNLEDLEAKQTNQTAKTWLENGLSVFGSAIMEYFSATCVCCYLKDTHHSARSLLRAYILKNKGILCASDYDILNNIEENYKRVFEKLIEYRQNLDNFPFDFMKLHKTREIKGRSTKPLLMLEYLAQGIIHELKGKSMHSLRETIDSIKEPYDHIHSIRLSHESGQYIVSLVLNEAGRNIKDYKPEMKFLEFPLYKQN